MKISQINFIVSTDNKYGIGKSSENKLLWHIPEELKYFKEKTENHIVIMGSKTYFSIPEKYRPLKNRFNIVLTTNSNLLDKSRNFDHNKNTDNNLLFTTYQNVFYHIHELNRENNINDKQQIFIMGGEIIYKLFYNDILDNYNEKSQYNNVKIKVYLTYIEKNYKCDIFFPKLSKDFTLIKYSNKQYSSKEDVYYRFLEYIMNPVKKTCTPDEQYLSIARNILSNGNKRIDRTQTGIISLFGTQVHYDICNTILIFITKFVPFKTVVHELLWFLRGQTNNKLLQKNNVHIWDGNSSREYLDSINLNNLEEGDCGACYGFQWRHFGATYKNCYTNYTGQGTDQIANVIYMLKNNPYSRRILLSAWNPSDLNKTCLPPCHVSIQFYVEEKQINTDSKMQSVRFLSGHMYQRSADWFLGEPFNILSYSILIYLIAEICNMKPNKLIITIVDNNIVLNNIR